MDPRYFISADGALLASQAAIELQIAIRRERTNYQRVREFSSLLREAAEINDPTINIPLHNSSIFLGERFQTVSELSTYISKIAEDMSSPESLSRERLIQLRDFSSHLSIQLCSGSLLGRRTSQYRRGLAA